MKVVYVAGKFRSKSFWGVVQNVRQAELVALEVWRAGAAALCPHTNTANFDGAADDMLWLEGDKEMLRRCDAVVLVPNWTDSAGAKAEVELAVSIGLPVFAYPGAPADGFRPWAEFIQWAREGAGQVLLGGKART